MTQQTFGDYLRARREAIGWSLRDVERITGGKVSNAYLSQLETGRVENPSIVVCHRLAFAYGLDFAELAERAVHSQPPPERVACCATCGRPLIGEKAP